MSKMFTQKIEKISRELFEKYQGVLSELIGRSHGIYALYNENELYYVGKATDLKTRVKQHLKDRHYAQWTRFSLFLTKKSSYIRDIESVIIAISDPKGNRNKPKGSANNQLIKKLNSILKEEQEKERYRLTNKQKRNTTRKKVSRKTRPVLKGYFSRSRPLVREYKGKEYKARLLTSGKIKYKGKTYNTPSAAAVEVVKKPTNGWTFWYVQTEEGSWKNLSSLA